MFGKDSLVGVHGGVLRTLNFTESGVLQIHGKVNQIAKKIMSADAA